jgi:hypothetical protein
MLTPMCDPSCTSSCPKPTTRNPKPGTQKFCRPPTSQPALPTSSDPPWSPLLLLGAGLFGRRRNARRPNISAKLNKSRRASMASHNESQELNAPRRPSSVSENCHVHVRPFRLEALDSGWVLSWDAVSAPDFGSRFRLPISVSWATTLRAPYVLCP